MNDDIFKEGMKPKKYFCFILKPTRPRGYLCRMVNQPERGSEFLKIFRSLLGAL